VAGLGEGHNEVTTPPEFAASLTFVNACAPVLPISSRSLSPPRSITRSPAGSVISENVLDAGDGHVLATERDGLATDSAEREEEGTAGLHTDADCLAGLVIGLGYGPDEFIARRER
jgi:hypothetical protein